MARTRENQPRGKLLGMLLRAGLLRAVVTTLVVLIWTQGAAAQPAAPRAYVANFGSNNVSIIDTGTHIVVATVPVGTNPRNVAVTPDGTRAYVTNDGSNNVSVIDTITNTVIATVAVGAHPYGVAITPNAARAYVTNPGSNNVSVIDTATNTVIATVVTGPLGPEPYGVAITPDGTRAYVANRGAQTVAVINTATNTVTATVNVGGPALNVAIGTTPNGVRAYVTQQGSNNLSVIATATNTVTTLTFSNPTNAVAITPDGTRVYVSHLFTSNVSVIATATNAVTTLAAGIQPSGIAFTPNSSLAYLTNNSNKVYVFETATTALVGAANVGSSPMGVAIAAAPPGLPPPPGPGTAPRAYVTNRFTSNVSVIDTGTDTLVSNVRVGNTPFGVAVTPDGSRVYVTNQGSNNVSVIATTSNTVVATVAVGSGPAGVAITPDGSRVYVADPPSNDVKVIDTGTNTVVGTVAMGAGSNPQSVVVSPDGSRYYVCNSVSNSVRVISTATNTTIANVTVGVLPLSVAITPNGSRVYVANSNSGTVSVINTSTNTVIATVSMGGFPRYVTASPDGSRVYVSNTGIFASQIISTATNTVLVNITGVLSWGVAFTPDSSRAYAADGVTGDQVKVVDMTTNAVVNTITLGGLNPEGVAILTLPALSINDVSVPKGNSGTTDGVFTVTMTRASAHNVTVNFATADGTAISGVDYQSNSGTVTFSPGETAKSITVPVNGNSLSEPDKTFFVNLSSPANAAIADAQGVGIIISPSSSLAINDVSVDKPASGTTDATFTVTLSAAAAQTVTVDFTTVNGTAQSGTDFESNSGTLSFAPGETSKQVVVHVLGGTPNTSDKMFFVNLSNPTNATLADAQGAGTIRAAVQIVVNETITVSDAHGVLPSAMIGVAENITVTDAPVVLPSVMIGVAENIVLTDAPAVLSSALIAVAETIIVTDTPQVFDTAQGINVVVMPVDSVTNTSPVTLTFSSITQAGNTTLVTSSSGPAPPADFRVGNPPIYYDLSTTAQFSGNVTVCISYAGVTFARRSPRLFHYENGVWVDRTVSVDTTNQIVCGSVTSLSPFALFEPAFTYGISLLYDPIKARKSGSTFPIKIQITDAGGNNLSSPQVMVTAVGIVRVSDDSSAPLEDSGDANPDFNFRYDATLDGTGGYIFNLSLRGLPTGTYNLNFRVGTDPSLHSARFAVK